MDHSGHGSNATACQMEMLWNWNTIDSCFLSSTWHVTNNAMFAASCIGTVFLVVGLEFLRRVGREYDAHITRSFLRQLRFQQSTYASSFPANCCGGPASDDFAGVQYATFRASPLQQLTRAVIYSATLGVAYLVMLMVMYYNGFIYVSVLIGAVLGRFLCDWMVVRIPYGGEGLKEGVRPGNNEVAGPTGCCA